MSSIVFGVGLFLLVVVYAIRINGWYPRIRAHPFAALFLVIVCAQACWLGAVKPPGTNDPPVIVTPATTNITLRLYWHGPDGRLYPIDALLKEVH